MNVGLCISTTRATLMALGLLAVVAEADDACQGSARLDALGVAWRDAEDAQDAINVAGDYGKQLWQAGRSSTLAGGDLRAWSAQRRCAIELLRRVRPAFPIFNDDQSAASSALIDAATGMARAARTSDHLRVLLVALDPADADPRAARVALTLDGYSTDAGGASPTIEFRGIVLPPLGGEPADAGIRPWLTGPVRQLDWLEAARLRAGHRLPPEPARPTVDLIVLLGHASDDHFAIEIHSDARGMPPGVDFPAWAYAADEHPGFANLLARHARAQDSQAGKETAAFERLLSLRDAVGATELPIWHLAIAGPADEAAVAHVLRIVTLLPRLSDTRASLAPVGVAAGEAQR